MTPIRVWAPEARQVECVVGADHHRMTSEPGGWWSWTPAGDGRIDYLLSVDGGDPVPDPRSAWLPRGVHGPSRTFDATAFDWTDEDWRGPREGRGTLGAVFYELHVGTFTRPGTLVSAIGHLDHLVDLGVDVVELMPVAAFGGSHGWGYDGVQPYSVHQAYGGPLAFQVFVDACHARGLGVCLDVVYNHVGPVGNYLPTFGPYFTEGDATPWGAAVNLDGPGSSEVRRWVVDNALRWFRDFHVDALRLDAVHALHDESPIHILAELSDETAALAEQLGRPLDLIAESDLNDPSMVSPTAAGGRGMTAQWDDDIHHALHVTLTGERQGYYADFAGGTEAWPEGTPLRVLAKTLTEAFLHDGRPSTFRGKVWGAPVDRETVSGHRFLAYLQNHDQVGNRAAGDRINETISPGQQAIGAALYLLSPYTPMIFMGEEWRASTPFQFFTSFDDQWLADAVRKGRREEFAAYGWAAEDVPDPQDPATWSGSVLNWAERGTPGHTEMLEFYRELTKTRCREPDLAAGDLLATTVELDETAGWVVMHRGRVHVVCNLGPRSRTVPLPDLVVDRVLVSWGRAPIVDEHGVQLDGHDVAVIRSVEERPPARSAHSSGAAGSARSAHSSVRAGGPMSA
ncbi:malto-oligosyltrehalose trehalohydrolase [Intrasporangium calvum]|uniref:Malto-oligosyltrehalose trehalohydrolase n=1 Tax=Intrasporangium calvum (strain ATCC 23552 / DSM 43043 / JCM 3097 / NBRC 12989 / NCIMB 10167 / NRRL B-3866 / 7 KIP) TaxID=710696 RepID=E6S6X2_INTC7|nr:malto-oligosyltrehalose trehalohydrolase [Intrasporangium calvum]ADU47867.1 maltooligosyl trehalose hydrolase [Intrasporangium calvum DSM 43043]